MAQNPLNKETLEALKGHVLRGLNKEKYDTAITEISEAEFLTRVASARRTIDRVWPLVEQMNSEGEDMVNVFYSLQATFDTVADVLDRASEVSKTVSAMTKAGHLTAAPGGPFDAAKLN